MYRPFVLALIVHSFHQQYDYIISENIINSMNNVRKLINLTIKDELTNCFFHKRPNTKFRLICTSSMFFKIVPLNAIRISSRDLSLPDYFNKSKSLII